MKKIIFMVLMLSFFVSCLDNYAEQIEKLKKVGLSEPCIMFIVCKLKNKDISKCSDFSKTCNNNYIFGICGGLDMLEKDELKFLKCLTKLK